MNRAVIKTNNTHCTVNAGPKAGEFNVKRNAQGWAVFSPEGEVVEQFTSKEWLAAATASEKRNGR